MGQDTEEAAEFVATVRGDHVAMKTWYMSDTESAMTLQAKYGPYPAMWKEVLNWGGWKEARREYLRHLQQQQQQQQSEAPKKRKSRWGTAASSGDSNGANQVGSNDNSNKRQSRWSNAESSNNSNVVLPSVAPLLSHTPTSSMPPIPGLDLVLPSHLPPHKQDELKKLQAKLRDINEKMENLEEKAARVDALPTGHRDRSPSPPPVYDAHGKRKNTRAVRWRERYTAERQDTMEKIMKLNPTTASVQSNLLVRKRTKKISIPIDQHPNYNFIGLIIGPRGKTQKELEVKTGCKIAIRGRGSVKEGARGRRDGKIMEGDNEPLHVVITGDDQRAVDAAADMVQQMLIVIDDEKNVHKQQQLRELALLNGTLKDDEFCTICAEKGHRAFECPRRFASNKPTLTIKCTICGDTSHPTRDCTQRPTEQTNQQELDSDYMSFMAELDGKKGNNASSAGNRSSPSSEQAIAVSTQLPPLVALPPPPPSVHTTDLPPPPPGLPPPPPPPSQQFMQQNSSLSLPPPPPVHGYQLPHQAGNIAVNNDNYLRSQQQQPQQLGYKQLHRPLHGGGGGQHQYMTSQQQGGNQPLVPQAYGRYPHQQQQQQQAPVPSTSQQPSEVRPGEETQGWDPSSYYGYDANGAGGFNWWE